MKQQVSLREGDALVIVDIQNDFLAGGALAVRGGDDVIPILNRYIDLFLQQGLLVVATRDWHPPNHVSFVTQGGPWPVHCVMGTRGAEFSGRLRLPPQAWVTSKASCPDHEAYSDFAEGDLAERFRASGIRRLFVGGLATDYCVLHTVRDALALGFEVFLLTDAVRAVNVRPKDGGKAQEEMVRRGAVPIQVEDIERGAEP